MYAAQLTAEWDPRPNYPLSDEEKRSGKAGMACHVWRYPELSLVELPCPDPAPGEVIVRVAACGVCGSDRHCYESDPDGYIIFSGPARFPCVLGHEYSGEVVAVGRGVKDLRPGDLVVPEGMLYCGICEACRRGLFNQCTRLDMVGFSSPGAYAEYIAVHEKHCWSFSGLAERLGDVQRAADIACMVEPVGCSFNGMYISARGMLPGSHVAIFGCGPIGLGAIALARAGGAASIIAFDVVEARLEVARAMGADEALAMSKLGDARTTPAEEIRRISKGWGADMVVEAAGNATRTMPEIERALAPNGKVVYLGRTGEQAPLMLDVLVSGANMIAGARGHAGQGIYPNILRMLERGKLGLEPMITARMPLRSAVDAVARSTTGKDAKIVLQG